MAIAAGILITVALITAFIPFLSFLTWIIVLLGMIFAIIALTKRQGLRGLSITSLCVGPIAFIIAVIVSISTIAMMSDGPAAGSADARIGDAPVTVDPNSYPGLSERELALLIKDPEDHVGDHFTVYSVVTQFDAATGECNFRANVAHDRLEETWNYDENVMFVAGDAEETCPELDNVVEGDVVKVLATASGSMDYATQIGGNTTVPLFRVDQIQIRN
ncbi:hypothetical protein GCM10027562_34080 [Arthrobacter pigmenti]